MVCRVPSLPATPMWKPEPLATEMIVYVVIPVSWVSQGRIASRAGGSPQEFNRARRIGIVEADRQQFRQNRTTGHSTARKPVLNRVWIDMHTIQDPVPGAHTAGGATSLKEGMIWQNPPITAFHLSAPPRGGHRPIGARLRAPQLREYEIAAPKRLGPRRRSRTSVATPKQSPNPRSKTPATSRAKHQQPGCGAIVTISGRRRTRPPNPRIAVQATPPSTAGNLETDVVSLGEGPVGLPQKGPRAPRPSEKRSALRSQRFRK